MRRQPDDELLRLVAETNDLRRSFAKALLFLAGSLLRARDRGEAFGRALALAFAPLGTAFHRQAARLARAGPQGADDRLRRLAAAVLARVAGHVEGGPNHLVACVRTVEARMADAARLLREGTASPRRLDAALARDLGLAFADAARLAPSLVPDALRAAARALTDSSADAGAG